MSTRDKEITDSKEDTSGSGSRRLNSGLKKFYFPTGVVLSVVVLSMMIHEAGFEYALDFPKKIFGVDTSKEIEGFLDLSLIHI